MELLYGKKVCILHPGNPRLDFRLKKTIKMLSDSGAEVYVLSYLSKPDYDIQDWENCKSLCRPRPLTLVKASENPIWICRVLWNLTVLRLKVLFDPGRPTYCKGLAKVASELNMDSYHCINVDAAEEYIKLAKKTKQPVIYESYEYFPDDLRKGKYPFSRDNKGLYAKEKKLVSKFAVATIVVGEEIAKGYKGYYGGKEPVVIHNVAEGIVEEIRPTRELVKFYFQSYLRPIYNIEKLIDAFGETTGPARLTIQGDTFDDEYRSTLMKRVESSKRASDIHLLTACDHSLVIEAAHEHDVGVISISALIDNDVKEGIRLALQNKLFTYASAGLALAISDYPAQKRILEGYRAAKTFSPDSIGEIASTMQWFIDNKHEIDRMKRESLRFGAVYSFKEETQKLASIYKVAFGSKERTLTN